MIKLDKLELPEFDAGDIRSEYTHYRSDSMEYRAQIGEDLDFYLTQCEINNEAFYKVC